MPRIDHALKDHFILYSGAMLLWRSVMTKYYVYRGVTYTKDGETKTNVPNRRLAKVYRGNTYFEMPTSKHNVCDHVYRGAHYMA